MLYVKGLLCIHMCHVRVMSKRFANDMKWERGEKRNIERHAVRAKKMKVCVNVFVYAAVFIK